MFSYSKLQNFEGCSEYMHRMPTRFHIDLFWVLGSSYWLQYPLSIRCNFDLQVMQTWLQISCWCVFNNPKLHSEHWVRFVLHLMCELLLAIYFQISLLYLWSESSTWSSNFLHSVFFTNRCNSCFTKQSNSPNITKLWNLHCMWRWLRTLADAKQRVFISYLDYLNMCNININRTHYQRMHGVPLSSRLM